MPSSVSCGSIRLALQSKQAAFSWSANDKIKVAGLVKVQRLINLSIVLLLDLFYN